MGHANFLIVSSILVSVGLTSGCNRAKSRSHEPVEKIDSITIRIYKDALENIKISKAMMLDFPDQLILMGKVGITEDRTNIVPTRVAGRIETISFASGEHVIQGQLLAKLFSPDFTAAKEEYLLSLRQEKNVPGNADASDFKNLAQMARKKLETMGLSSQDIDLLREGKDSSLLSIRAPRSGVIIAKSAVLGNLVNMGDTLFMIGDLSKVWFVGDLYPEDLAKVKLDQEVRIRVEGEKEMLSGKISFISPIVDPSTRSIKVRALIDNPKNILKADMYVQGNITLNRDRALLIPSVAIVRGSDGYSVFKCVNPQTIERDVASLDFRKIPVRIGLERQGMTAILEGIKDGDEVITDGAWLLDSALKTTQKAND